jgi:CheY-like chemotaxis protein
MVRNVKDSVLENVILLADDDPDDREMTRKALARHDLAANLRMVTDGEELLDYLHHRGRFASPAPSPAPKIILLDLNMPKKDGREALAEIKQDPMLRHIPVVVMTTSQTEEDIARSYQLGSSSFISKPVTFEALSGIMKVLGDYWFKVVELPDPKAAV